MNKKPSISWNHAVNKLHGIVGGIIGVFLLWMLIWGVILGNRDTIRAISHRFGNDPHSKYSLDFSEEALSIDDILRIGWKTLGGEEEFQRLEVKWEGGAPIYRIRFRDKDKSEVTIHAVTGEILILPTKRQEIKKIAQDFHTLNVLSENLRWVFDVLALLVIAVTVSGIIIFFLKKKKISGTLTRKLHNISSLFICIPLVIMAITGIMLNHEGWLESQSKKYISSSQTEKPALDYTYNLLPISSQKAVEIFQNQFPNPRGLRRAVLTYSKECGTLVWNIEPNDNMRITSIIDAYTGEMIKSSHEITLIEFIDQVHEWLLFGGFSVYVLTIVGIVLLISVITGWMLTPQTLRRRVIRYSAEEIPMEYSLAEIVAHQKEYLHNISTEGLCFKSHKYIDKGLTISLEIPLVIPTFKEKGKVVWCAKKNDHYDVGVQFVGKDLKTHANLVEQVCDIEDYKGEVLKKEGRELSSEEAALEWLSKH